MINIETITFYMNSLDFTKYTMISNKFYRTYGPIAYKQTIPENQIMKYAIANNYKILL